MVRYLGSVPKFSVDNGWSAGFRPRMRPAWKDMYRPSPWKSCFVNVPNILMAPHWQKSLKIRRTLVVATIEVSNTGVSGVDGGQKLTITMQPAYSRWISLQSFVSAGSL